MWFWQFFITHFTFGRSATKCSLFIYKKYIICDSGKRTMKWCGKHLKRTPRALKGSRWLFRCDSYGVRSARPLFRWKVRTSLQRPHFKENRLLPFTTSFENCRLHSGRHGNGEPSPRRHKNPFHGPFCRLSCGQSSDTNNKTCLKDDGYEREHWSELGREQYLTMPMSSYFTVDLSTRIASLPPLPLLCHKLHERVVSWLCDWYFWCLHGATLSGRHRIRSPPLSPWFRTLLCENTPFADQRETIYAFIQLTDD